MTVITLPTLGQGTFSPRTQKVGRPKYNHPHKWLLIANDMCYMANKKKGNTNVEIFLNNMKASSLIVQRAHSASTLIHSAPLSS